MPYYKSLIHQYNLWSTMSDAMPIFFAGNESVADENTKWFSVTKQAWLGTDHSPVVWSHNGALRHQQEIFSPSKISSL